VLPQERPALHARAAEVDRHLQRVAGDAGRDGGDGRPGHVALGQQDAEAVALGAHEVLDRNADVLEAELGAQAGPVAHLVGDRAPGHAGEVEGHDQAREPDVRAAALHRPEHAGEAGDGPVGDHTLVPVHDVLVAVPPDRREPAGVAHVLRDHQVEPGLLVADRVAREDRAVAAEEREEPGLQVRVSREQDGSLREHRGAEHQGHAGAGGGQLLHREAHADQADPEPAELLRQHRPGQAQPVAPVHEVPREVVVGLLVQLERDRRHLGPRELADRVAEPADLRGELVEVELHRGLDREHPVRPQPATPLAAAISG